MKPGDQVYVSHAGYTGYQTVTKVGRKWAETDRLRFDKDTLLIDGRGTGLGSTGQVWLSLGDWQQDKAAKDAWLQLKDLISRSWAPPKNLNAEDILGIITMLRSNS